MSPQPVSTVPVTLGGKPMHLLWGPAARYHLQRWGFWNQGQAPNLAFFGSMLGTLDEKGNWQSARIADPLDLAASVTSEEERQIFAWCMAAIKNTEPAPATAEAKPEDPQSA